MDKISLGKIWFGDNANYGETIAQTFDRLVSEPSGALANNTNITGVLLKNPGIRGIYYKGSKSDILSQPNFLLHEVVHLVTPEIYTGKTGFYNPDEILVNEFGIKMKKGESFTQAVSRFFNGGCKPEDRDSGIS